MFHFFDFALFVKRECLGLGVKFYSTNHGAYS
jgi:hypothetical protein